MAATPREDARCGRHPPGPAASRATPNRRCRRSPAASQEEIRRQNLGAVLRYVHVHGPTSRAELTSRLGLNRSTIGALAADLAAAGLVSEEVADRARPRRAGRPSWSAPARPGSTRTR